MVGHLGVEVTDTADQTVWAECGGLDRIGHPAAVWAPPDDHGGDLPVTVQRPSQVRPVGAGLLDPDSGHRSSAVIDHRGAVGGLVSVYSGDHPLPCRAVDVHAAPRSVSFISVDDDFAGRGGPRVDPPADASERPLPSPTVRPSVSTSCTRPSGW